MLLVMLAMLAYLIGLDLGGSNKCKDIPCEVAWEA